MTPTLIGAVVLIATFGVFAIVVKTAPDWFWDLLVIAIVLVMFVTISFEIGNAIIEWWGKP